MTVIAKKYYLQRKSAQIIRREDPKIWKENKRKFYIWIKNQCMRQKIKDQIQWVIEIYISCSNIKGTSLITNETLLKKYNERHPNNTISRRTLYRYLAIAVDKKLIKRSEQLSWNSPCKTTLLGPKLAERSVPNWQTNLLYHKRTSLYDESKPCSDSSHDSDYDEKLKRLIERDRRAGLIS